MYASLKYALVRLVAGRVDREPSSTAPATPQVLSEHELRQVSGGAAAPRGTWAKLASSPVTRGDAPRGSW